MIGGGKATSLRRLLRKALNSSFSKEVVALYVIYAANSLLPLVTVPYLARVLRPTNFGLLSFFQSLAMILGVVVDFGFAYSATRTLARTRGQPEIRSTTLGEVMAAKLIIVGLSTLSLFIAYPFIPLFRSNPRLLALGITWGAFQGLNLVWYFQGIGKLTTQCLIDTCSRTLFTASVYFFIRLPNDTDWVLAFNALASLLTFGVGLHIASKDTKLSRPGVKGTLKALGSAWNLFLYRAAGSLTTSGNGLILGFFCSPSSVGFYSGGERVVRGLMTVSQPISLALYANLNHRMSVDVQEARRLFLAGAALIGAISTSMGAALFFSAPILVKLMLGQRFLPTIAVLHILAWLIPITSMTLLLGVQWMVPLGLEKPFTRITVSTSILNLVVAAGLSPFFSELGVCWAAVIAQTVAALTCFIYLDRRGLSPFRSFENYRLNQDSTIKQDGPLKVQSTEKSVSVRSSVL